MVSGFGNAQWEVAGKAKNPDGTDTDRWFSLTQVGSPDREVIDEATSTFLSWLLPVPVAPACFGISRAPATRLCFSGDDARRWLGGEATAMNVSVEWVAEVPTSPR
jgi:hypothetical protein